MMFEPDARERQIRTMLFVNDKRLAPFIVKAVEKADIPAALSYIDWRSRTLVSRGRGFLHMDGVIPLLPQAEDIVRDKWGRAPLTMPLLELNGAHLLEAYFDNRDGATCAILISLLVAMGADPEPLVDPDFIDVMAAVSETYLFGDLTQNEDLALRLELKVNPNTPEAYLEVFPDSFELFMHQILKVLDLDMEGAVRREGRDFVAEYTLTDPLSLAKGGEKGQEGEPTSPVR